MTDIQKVIVVKSICLSQLGLLLQRYHRLSGLSKHLFLTVLEAGSLRSGCPRGPVHGEGPLPGLQRAVFLPCPHMAERDPLSPVSSYKDTNLIHEGSTLMT